MVIAGYSSDQIKVNYNSFFHVGLTKFIRIVIVAIRQDNLNSSKGINDQDENESDVVDPVNKANLNNDMTLPRLV